VTALDDTDIPGVTLYISDFKRRSVFPAWLVWGALVLVCVGLTGGGAGGHLPLNAQQVSL
jgi:hypothetical protein